MDLVDVVDQLGWSRFGVLGHSMGGAISCVLAASYPERVQYLVLLENLGPISRPAKEAPAQLRSHIAQMKGIHPSRARCA